MSEKTITNPVREPRFRAERLATTLVVAVAAIALDGLGPHGLVFAVALVVTQLGSTAAIQNRFESASTELAVFLFFDHSLMILAPLLMPLGWGPALVIAMYSIGVNATFLPKRWLVSVAAYSLVGFGFSGLVLDPAGGIALFAIAAILVAHAATNRTSDLLLAARTIEEMKELQLVATLAAEEATWLASHDALTGLGNRRLLTELLSEAVTADDDSGLILLDLDGFKVVNDDYGHHYGDLVLLEVAERLRATLTDCRPTGRAPVAIRLGGDEFAVFLSGTKLTEGTAIAKRVNGSFQTDVDIDGLMLPIRVSIGVAVLGGAEAAELLRRADTAMYEAKRSGGGLRAAGSDQISLH